MSGQGGTEQARARHGVCLSERCLHPDCRRLRESILGLPLFEMPPVELLHGEQGAKAQTEQDNGAKSKTEESAVVSEANPARIFQSGEPEFQELPAWARKVLV